MKTSRHRRVTVGIASPSPVIGCGCWWVAEVTYGKKNLVRVAAQVVWQKMLTQRLRQGERSSNQKQRITDMSKMAEVRAAYKQAKADQVRNAANPDRAAAKRTARIAGAMLFFAGTLFSGGVYVLFVRESLVSPVLTGAALGLTGIGLYLIVVGKMPGRRR